MKKLTIAIDGPAGAGKSTVAQIVAQRLNYVYIDTGAMYRAITWQAICQNLSGEDVKDIIQIARSCDLRLVYQNDKTHVSVDGVDVTEQIRLPEVSRMVSAVALIPEVRAEMLVLQRNMGSEGGVVMDGRDIGTHVLPGADVKIFLTASIPERARRRWLELQQKGFAIEFEQMQQEIITRDKIDSEREAAPLMQAADAILLDTTGLGIEEVVQAILQVCKERL
ncbi:MAG: cmk [Firmicutes bacterium]|nr:cmk [Bacillota bacterium]